MEILLVYYICMVIATLLMFILGVLMFNEFSDIFEFGLEKIVGIIWLILFVPPLAIIVAIAGIIVYLLNK